MSTGQTRRLGHTITLKWSETARLPLPITLLDTSKFVRWELDLCYTIGKLNQLNMCTLWKVMSKVNSDNELEKKYIGTVFNILRAIKRGSNMVDTKRNLVTSTCHYHFAKKYIHIIHACYLFLQCTKGTSIPIFRVPSASHYLSIEFISWLCKVLLSQPYSEHT